MSAIADLSLSDGTTARAFTVVNPQMGTTPALWRFGTGLGAPRLSLTERRVKGAPRSKTECVLRIPITQTINGLETVADTLTVSITIVKPDVASTTVRAAARNYVANALKAANVIDAIDNDSLPY